MGNRATRTMLAALLAGTAGLFAGTAAAADNPVLGDYHAVTGSGSGGTYSFTTHSPYWSAVALTSFGTANDDLAIYDSTGTALLGSSTLTAQVQDFVAVDSNRLPFGTYQAVVQHTSGTGGYSVELAQGTDVMDPHTQTYFEMPTGAAVQVKDVWLNQGQCMGMEVTNSAHNNGFMALMGSDPANPATWVRGRIQSVAEVSFNTDNILVFTKQFTYTAIRSAWYGLVVVNNNDNTPGPYLAKYRPIAC